MLINSAFVGEWTTYIL